jgi:hypothetical protein
MDNQLTSSFALVSITTNFCFKTKSTSLVTKHQSTIITHKYNRVWMLLKTKLNIKTTNGTRIVICKSDVQQHEEIRKLCRIYDNPSVSSVIKWNSLQHLSNPKQPQLTLQAQNSSRN